MDMLERSLDAPDPRGRDWGAVWSKKLAVLVQVRARAARLARACAGVGSRTMRGGLQDEAAKLEAQQRRVERLARLEEGVARVGSARRGGGGGAPAGGELVRGVSVVADAHAGWRV